MSVWESCKIHLKTVKFSKNLIKFIKLLNISQSLTFKAIKNHKKCYFSIRGEEDPCVDTGVTSYLLLILSVATEHSQYCLQIGRNT